MKRRNLTPKLALLAMVFFLFSGIRNIQAQAIDVNEPICSTNCRNQSFCVESGANGSCATEVALKVNASDNRTAASQLNYAYSIDYFNDGTEDVSGSTDSFFSRFVKVGIHHIKWTIKDKSGNIAVCEYDFIVEDCAGPDAQAVKGLAIDLSREREAHVSAVELNSNSYDWCSGVNDFRIGVPSGGPGQLTPPMATHHTFNGDDLDRYGAKIPVDLWVKDYADNWSYVSTYILLENKAGTCKTKELTTTAVLGNLDAEIKENIETTNRNSEGVSTKGFELHQNMPNPFKETTIIGFRLPGATTATLKVYDGSGRLLKSVAGAFTKGYHEITLNRRDLSGSGVLHYTLETAKDSATKKMIIME